MLELNTLRTTTFILLYSSVRICLDSRRSLVRVRVAIETLCELTNPVLSVPPAKIVEARSQTDEITETLVCPQHLPAQHDNERPVSNTSCLNPAASHKMSFGGQTPTVIVLREGSHLMNPPRLERFH